MNKIALNFTHFTQNLFIFLRVDGQFPGGVYTTENIPPTNIEVI
jgi:hypothetical protein